MIVFRGFDNADKLTGLRALTDTLPMSTLRKHSRLNLMMNLENLMDH